MNGWATISWGLGSQTCFSPQMAGGDAVLARPQIDNRVVIAIVVSSVESAYSVVKISLSPPGLLPSCLPYESPPGNQKSKMSEPEGTLCINLHISGTQRHLTPVNDTNGHFADNFSLRIFCPHLFAKISPPCSFLSVYSAYSVGMAGQIFSFPVAFHGQYPIVSSQ